MIFSGYGGTIPYHTTLPYDDDDSRLVLPLVRFLPTYEYVRLTFVRKRHNKQQTFFAAQNPSHTKKIISETTIDRPWHCL